MFGWILSGTRNKSDVRAGACGLQGTCALHSDITKCPVSRVG